MIFDNTSCQLGEGVFWHPLREELFWFDILSKKLYQKKESENKAKAMTHTFKEMVSAAAIIDSDRLLIASETSLFVYSLSKKKSNILTHLEKEIRFNRSNDGRADPWGGFWIGTMGKKAQHASGAIYRFFKKELREVHSQLTIPNAISFDKDNNWLYFTDTPTGKVMRQPLSASDGWPEGKAEVFLDFAKLAHHEGQQKKADGAVVDSERHLWIAHWGSYCVSRYGPSGRLIEDHYFETKQVSCPAIGGVDGKELFVTSAHDGLNKKKNEEEEHAGKTFKKKIAIRGQLEPLFLL